MAISATISAQATAIVGARVPVTLVVTNTGTDAVTITSILPITNITSDTSPGRPASVLNGFPLLIPGVNTSVAGSSGTRTIVYDICFEAPSTGPFGTGTGTYSITADIVTSDGSLTTPTADTIAVSPSPLGPQASLANGTTTVASSSIASGATDVVTLTAVDANGTPLPVASAQVNFATVGAGTSTGVFGTVTNPSAGVYKSTFTGIVSGNATDIQAYINNGAVSTSLPTITVTAGAISPVTSVISVAAASVGNGLTDVLTLTAKDAAGNAITTGGATVVFTATGGTSTGTVGSTTDNSNGTYTATFTATGVGTAKTIHATINGVAVSSTLPTVTVVARPALVSATIPSAGTSMAIVFTANLLPLLPATSITGFTVSGNTVSSASRTASNTVTLVLGTPVLSGATPTVSYSPGNLTDSTPVTTAAIVAHAVVNNSTLVLPALASAVIPSAGTSLVMTFTASTSPMLPATAVTGFSVSGNTIASASRTGALEITLVLDTTVLSGETPTVSYSAGNVTDSTPLSLATIVAHAIVNNSTQTSLAPTANLVFRVIGGTGMFQDVAKTMPVTTNGQAVKAWADQSVSGNDLTNSTGVVYVATSSINSKPGVTYTGGQHLDFTTQLSLAAMTAIVVMQQTNSGDPSTSSALVLNSPSAGGGYLANVNFSSGQYPAAAYADGSNPSSVYSADVGLAEVLGVIKSATEYTSYLNGHLGTVQSSTDLCGFTALGASVWNDGVFAGDIAEVLIYDTSLSGAPLTQLKAYLTARYGITQV